MHRCPHCNWSLALRPFADIYGPQAGGWAAVCPNPRRRGNPPCAAPLVRTKTGDWAIIYTRDLPELAELERREPREARDPGEQRELLIETVRSTIRWRQLMIERYADDVHARIRSERVVRALRRVVAIINELPSDDPVFALHDLSRAPVHKGLIPLPEAALMLLSRFRIGVSYERALQEPPTAEHVRRLLRQINSALEDERVEASAARERDKEPA